MSILIVDINSLKSEFIVSLLIVSQSSASRYCAGKIISEECGSSRLSLITPIPNDVDGVLGKKNQLKLLLKLM
jgi:hypothetical protein